MNKRKKTLKVMLCVSGLFILPVFCNGQNMEKVLIQCKEAYEVQKKILEQEGFIVNVEEDSYSEGSEGETNNEKIIRKISFSSGEWTVIDPSIKDTQETKKPFIVFEHIDVLYNILQDKNYTIKYQKEDVLGSYSCHLLYFEPKKKKKDSIKGQIWIEKESALIVNAVFIPTKLPFFVKKFEHNLSFVKINEYWLPQSFIIEIKLSIPFLKKKPYHRSVYNFYDWKIGGKNDSL